MTIVYDSSTIGWPNITPPNGDDIDSTQVKEGDRVI